MAALISSIDDDDGRDVCDVSTISGDAFCVIGIIFGGNICDVSDDEFCVVIVGFVSLMTSISC